MKYIMIKVYDSLGHTLPLLEKCRPDMQFTTWKEKSWVKIKIKKKH